MRFRVIGRLLQIQRVLVRHGLDEIILATHLFRPLRFAFYLSPATWFERRKGGSLGERIRLALEELGTPRRTVLWTLAPAGALAGSKGPTPLGPPAAPAQVRHRP